MMKIRYKSCSSIARSLSVVFVERCQSSVVDVHQWMFIFIPVFFTWYQSLHAPVDDRLCVFRCVVEYRLSVYFWLKGIETLTQGFKCYLSVLGNFWLVTDLLRSVVSW
ncbi:hypothetical protein Hdeb2414_s0003g00091991 [Helianthus debilis subsp. tardiflorus]